MSCAIWRELAASGEALLREGSPERARAEGHFATCASCAERAFLLDPSWAVRRLPDAGFTAAEIARLERSLGDAGRLREIEGAIAPVRRGWRAAAVGGLLALGTMAGLLSIRSGADRTAESPGAPEARLQAAAEAAPQEAGGRAGVSLPAIGAVAPAAARVYELGEDDFALVMVVHETLDL